MTFGTKICGKCTDKFHVKYCLSVKENSATVQNVHVVFNQSNIGRICRPTAVLNSSEMECNKNNINQIIIIIWQGL